MEHLDIEKHERKAHEEDVTARQEAEHRRKQEHGENVDEEAGAHQPRKVPKGKTRMVTDPTTGRDIEVEDQDEESMEPVKNPTVCGVLKTMNGGHC